MIKVIIILFVEMKIVFFMNLEKVLGTYRNISLLEEHNWPQSHGQSLLSTGWKDRKHLVPCVVGNPRMSEPSLDVTLLPVKTSQSN